MTASCRGIAAIALVACASPKPALVAPVAGPAWPVPSGWRSEIIPFPLAAATTIRAQLAALAAAAGC